MGIIAKHGKLWSKFFANWRYFRSSHQRQIIKAVKGLWFLAAWPLELLGDLIIKRTKKNSRVMAAPKILIIKIDQLGDLLFSTFLPPALKQQWPEAKIDYLIQEKSLAILKNNPDINNIFLWSNLWLDLIPGRGQLRTAAQRFLSGRRKNQKTIKALQDQKYNLVINARAFWPSSNIPWRKLGGQLIAFDISQFSFLADNRAEYLLKDQEEENYRRLLFAAGVDQKIISNLEPRGRFYNFSPVTESLPPDYFLVSPVSFDPEKTWKPEVWKEFLIKLRAAQPQTLIILNGLPSQRFWLEKIEPEKKDGIKIITDLELGQLASLIRSSRAFIGLESFPAHLSLALKKETFCLVNGRLFYSPSLKRCGLVDGRSMLPDLKESHVFDLEKTGADDIIPLLR